MNTINNIDTSFELQNMENFASFSSKKLMLKKDIILMVMRYGHVQKIGLNPWINVKVL